MSESMGGKERDGGKEMVRERGMKKMLREKRGKADHSPNSRSFNVEGNQSYVLKVGGGGDPLVRDQTS